MNEIEFANILRLVLAFIVLSAFARIGWDVVNPAKMDAEELDKKEGVDPLTFDPHKSAEDQETLRHLLSRDLEAVAKKCTAIYMLNGWEESRGAQAEWQLARAIAEVFDDFYLVLYVLL